MRQISGLVAVLAVAAAVFSTAVALAGEPPLDDGKTHPLCGHAAHAAALIEASGPRGEAPREADADTDVLHYLLDLEIIPEYAGPTLTGVRVQGVCTIEAASTVAGLTTFTVDLRDNLTVDAVTGDMAGWSRSGHTVVITLDRGYNVGETFTVTVSYQGYPQGGGWGAFRLWTRNNSLVVATLSQPFYAQYWWPCKDALGDKSTMQLHCTVPSAMVVASNGILEGVDSLPGDRSKYRWRETYPMIPYLASLAATNYQVYQISYAYDEGGPQTMPVLCYLYPDHWDFTLGRPKAAYKTGCDELPAMLDTLGLRYGLYPFRAEKYGVAETGGTGGLGANMEHQTCSSMYQVNNYSDIMCHELAHQWWGDNVTCATWYDIWLNEGFASWSECLYRELKAGGGWSSYQSRLLARRPVDTDARVYRTSIATVNDIFSTNDVYNKGCWVVHMLRGVMGDQAFFDALLDYRALYEGGSATTDEFAACISASFGRDLTWFTDQWVMNAGSPDYVYSWRAYHDPGRDFLLLRVEQTQPSRGFPLMTMPVPIRVTTTAGVEDFIIWCLHDADHFAIRLAAAPTSVVMDPDGWVLSRSVTASSPGSFPTVCQGDLNGDGQVDGRDIQPFVDVLTGPAGYPAAWQRADMNFDGLVDLADLPLFVETLLSGAYCPN